MKKLSGLFLILGIVGALWFAYGRKSPPIPPGEVVTGQAEKNTGEPMMDQHQRQSAVLPAETGENPRANPRNPIPVLDTASPVYQSALVLLENRFIRLLERETQAESWPPEQLVEVANRLAKLRLAMAMHEASIADYTLVGNRAVIVIPAYLRAGEDFQNQLRSLLPPGFGSEDFQRELFQRFGYYGRYAQQLQVGLTMQDIEGQPIKAFDVLHRVDMPSGLMGGSRLTDIYLGPYAPFIGAFPKE